ncbi:MAG: hypothetical protein IKY02_04685 [Lachnospiraceae bacterium]|nr:hypothetical protein [Lachnospiraceae bacterium]
MKPGLQKLITAITAVLTILVAVLPMGLAPAWNGEKPAHRNQYEVAARAFLEGHLDLDYGEVDPKLLALENPYDPAARKAAGASYHWDHAFYDGKYYMYFGVVPVFLLFLPYRALTGADLTTFIGTAAFVSVFIAGLFALFLLLRKKFFPELSFGLTLSLASALSLVSVWYASSAPALYCTAISSGLAMEIWSLFFFVKAVYGTERENRAILYAGLGAFFGALAFGCRPPVALANVLVIPMLVDFLRKRKFSLKLLGKLVLAALPYAVIGGLLMYYNYVRFGSVLEFGQSYQLTIVDVSKGVKLTPAFIGKGLRYYLWNLKDVKSLVQAGALVTFPILCFPLAALANPKAMKLIWKNGFGLFVTLLVTPFIILLVDIAGSPVFLPRYRMDFYWIFGLAAFVSIGWFARSLKKKAVFYGIVGALAAAAVVMAVLLFFTPYDANFASTLVK